MSFIKRIAGLIRSFLGTLLHLRNKTVGMFQALTKHFAFYDDVFIGRNFKVQFVLKFCLFAVLGGGLFTALLLYYCRGTLTTSFQDARIVIKETSFAILPAIVYTNLIMFAMAVVTVVVVTFWIVRRIRKPLFRFEKDVKSIAEGDLTTKIEYRPFDQTTVMAENLNRMTLNFEKKIQDIQSGFKKLIEAAGDGSVPNDLVVNLIRIHRWIERSFRIESNKETNTTMDAFAPPTPVERQSEETFDEQK